MLRTTFLCASAIGFSLALLLVGVSGEALANPRDKPVSRKVAPKPKLARCLPVVAPKCGCVYRCGVGWPVGKKAQGKK
ncbi:MAG: hypothetical protein KAI47_27855, partial [Deltaproteobacteria bacterium]|nr:hypothetical protein [Deltaproteobacteria bacterium]